MSDTIKAGDHLDTGVVYKIDDNGEHGFTTMGGITLGARIVIFGGPAPFSRLDTEQAIEYSKAAAEMVKYVNYVYAIYVQDAFVCKEFEKQIREKTNSRELIVLADGDAFFARNYQLAQDFTYQGLGLRSRRWSAVVNNGLIEYFALDEFSEINLTHPKHILKFLKENS